MVWYGLDQVLTIHVAIFVFVNYTDVSPWALDKSKMSLSVYSSESLQLIVVVNC